MLNSKDKESLIKLGILIGSFILIFSILLIMTFFSRSSWEKGLRTSVLEVLESYSPNTYISADFVKINSNLSVSAAVYELKKTVTTNEKDFAVIIRIPTIVGPEPAVFICNSKTVNFVGYAINNGKAKNILSENNSFNNISYWVKNIYNILEKAGINYDK